MVLTIISVLILLVLSAFFSLSETALTAASESLMHEMERRGHHRAVAVNQLLAKREKFIGAILLGNNLVNIMASALATGFLISLVGDAGVAYATVVMTLLVLIFSEIMPKTFAIRHANKTALAVAPTVQTLVILLSPVVRTLQFVVRLTLKLIGADRLAEVTPDARLAELRGAIEVHAGEEIEDEKAMLRSVLDLSDLEVGEILVHRKKVEALDADLPPDVILEKVLESAYSRLPLWKDRPDNIVGILNAKALLRAVQAHPGDLKSLNVLAVAAKPWFIPNTTSVLSQLQAFRDRCEHFALVVDEYGGLMGVVTLEDILEEIVGDISDEHDDPVVGVEVKKDGSYVVEGSVTIRDLNRQFEWCLPDNEASTIAGLVLHEARRIPDEGQAFSFHGFRMEILKRERNRIARLRLKPLSLDDVE